MRAALALLGQAPIGTRGRRIAVLGDMLELGPRGRGAASRRWPMPSSANARRPRVLRRPADASAVGGASLRAPGRLCRDRRGARSRRCSARSRAGDAVMVKGSLGSQMGPIVKALKRRYSAHGARERRRCKVEPMLYWLADFSEHDLVLQRLPLPHLPHRRRDDHRAGVRVPVRAVDHRSCCGCAQGKGQPIRADGPQSHLVDQARHADHGRADDPVGHRGLDAAVGQSAQSLCLDRARRHARLRPGRLLRRLSEGDASRPTAASPAGLRLVDRSGRSRSSPASRSRASAARRSRPRWRSRSSRSWCSISAGSSSIFGAFIIVGAGNAVNLTDGLDGLAIVPVMIAAAQLRRDRLSRRQRRVRRLSADPLRRRAPANWRCCAAR